MKPRDLEQVTLYVNEHIDSFHQNRIEKIRKLNLKRVLVPFSHPSGGKGLEVRGTDSLTTHMDLQWFSG